MDTNVQQPVVDALEKAFGKTETEPSLKAYEAISNIDIDKIDSLVKDLDNIEKHRKESKTKVEKQLFAPELLVKPKGDINLVMEITRVLLETMGEDVAKYFNMNGGISFVFNKHSLLQRIVISRYFTNLLVRFRSYVEIEGILTTIRYIKVNGTHQEWFNTLVREVLPFMLQHRIFDFFIARDAYVYNAVKAKAEELANNKQQ